MWHDTLARLDELTDPVEFERMCVDLLKRFGFPDIVPLGPGQRDQGVDAESFSFPNSQVFQFSLQRTWQTKLKSTIGKLRAHGRRIERDAMLVFVTNQKTSPESCKRISRYAARFHIRAKILGREWLRLQLETNKDLKNKYLSICESVLPQSQQDSYEILRWFSLPDFVRHIFVLTVHQNRPYTSFFDSFFRLRLLPYLENPFADHGLFPIKKGGATIRSRIRFGEHQVRSTAKEVVDQEHPLPDGTLFYTATKRERTPFKLHFLHGGLLICERRTPFRDFLGAVEVVLIFTNMQFARVLSQLFPNVSATQREASRVVERLRERLSRLVARELAKSHLRQPLLVNIADFMEWYFGTDRNYWIVSQFLGELGDRHLQRLLQAGSPKDIESTVSLLCDERVPITTRRTVYRSVMRLPIDSNIVKMCRMYAMF